MTSLFMKIFFEVGRNSPDFYNLTCTFKSYMKQETLTILNTVGMGYIMLYIISKLIDTYHFIQNFEAFFFCTVDFGLDHFF